MANKLPLVIVATECAVAQLPAGDVLVASALGTGTPDATKFLRGDGTWQVFGALALVAALTGPITSNGAGLTAVASQTGTGTTFAMSAGPTFTGTVAVATLVATHATSATIDTVSTATASLSGFTAKADTTAILGMRTYGSTIGTTAFGLTLANYSLVYAEGAASLGLIIGTTTSDPLIFGTNNTEKMRLTSEGNLGLGVVAPDNFGNYTGMTISNTTGAFLFVKSTTGTITGQLIADNSLSAVQIGSRTNHPVLFQINNTTRLTLNTAGSLVFTDLTITNQSLIRSDTTGFINMGFAASTGARIQFFGSTHASLPGRFVFKTDSGAAIYTLTGNDSLLSWDGSISDLKGDVRDIPQNSKSAAYTLVLADAGKHIFHPSADTTARTFTIDSNATVAYAIGTAITFVNQNSAGVVTIAITTDTMRLAVAGTTGSRTLAANGVATAIKVTSTEWIISGSGLT